MEGQILQREIPSTKEQLPAVGIGTWKAFDVTDTPSLQRLGQVLEVMHDQGGPLIDSSPMYGAAEEVVGKLTHGEVSGKGFFYATKVWTKGQQAGIRQMENSMHLMKRSVIDLMQIHNLVDWKAHLETLREWKAQGRIRYIGITHYTDSMHDELANIIATTPIDFVQFNYSITNRHAEERLMPTARDKGVAILINRPVGEGKLMKMVKYKPLPAWASDYDIFSWGQFFLKFIIAHPAVTCVIPGTGNPEHMKDNMSAGLGRMPDEAGRNKMSKALLDLA